MLDPEADFDLAGVLTENHPPGWIEPPPPEPYQPGPDVRLGDQGAGPPPPYEPGDPGPDAGPPPRPESGPPAKPEPKKNRFKWIRDVEDRNPQWLILNIFEENCLAVLFGEPGCMKTFLAIDFGCCITAGIDFHGLPVKQHTVVFLIGEGFNGFRRRVKAWCDCHSVDIQTFPLCVSSWPGELTNSKDVDAIISEIHELTDHEKPGLIVIDTLARNFGPGNENETADMGIFNAACDRLRREFNAAVLTVHHSGLSDKTRSRGSVALNGALDTEYRMEHGEDGVYRVFCTKMKEFAKPLPMAFTPKTIDLGTVDDRGEPVTSMILESVNFIPSEKKAKGMGTKQLLMKEILDSLVQDRDQALINSGGTPEGCCLEKEWLAACRDAGCTRKNLHDNKSLFFVQGDMVYSKAYA